ncbi:flagellin [Rhabdaerophilum sp. SD176]|uniref:flagellin n=1 Tax=Rhabdaerophilum sp. SD176 TaxID=2983548 RepID=UPI0024DF43BE|nr:flagellin [Rhabdaerophilum sp. SD176]
MYVPTSLYPYAGGTLKSKQNARLLLSMRYQLDDLQRQIASGKKSQTFGGLGDMRVSSLTFRNQTGVTEGYTSVIDITSIRLKIMDQSTNELRTLVDKARSVMLETRGTGGYPEITAGVKQVQAQFEQIVTSLNNQHEGLYLYSGRTRDVRPVVDANTIMWGDGTNAGLRQVIDERRQADLGVTGLGRMTTNLVGSNVTLAEDAVGNPFGIKLVAGSVGGAMSNVTVTGPAGAPPQLDVNFTGLPLAGERISFTVQLPDGKTVNLGFAVDQAGTADDTVFPVGATPAATAANLQAAINSRLTSIGQGELRAASGLVAAREFFSGSVNNPPPRVAGPPFNTATAYAPAGTRPTVIWYRGDDDTLVAARDTQRAEVDGGTVINFGARANETALRESMVALGMFLAEDYPPGIASTQDRFDGAAARAIEVFGSTGGPNAILEMNGDFGRASSQVKDAETRHEDRKVFLSSLLAEIENANKEEAILQLTSLQTTLEASYSVTSRLSQLSLVNYL